MYKSFFYLTLALAVTGCGEKIDTSKGKYKAAEKYFKSFREKATIDAGWASGRRLVLSVYDDGTNRDGYAMYACEQLKSYNIDNVTVEIIDAVKINKNSNNWVTLGKYKCK